MERRRPRANKAEDQGQLKEGGSRTWQFSKTKMCKFHLIGICMKGDQCQFAHEKYDLKDLPDLTCTKLCKALIQTGVCPDANCSYAHSKDELRATSAFHKTKMCRFSQIGHCALGAKCNFAHSNEEVRPLDLNQQPLEQQRLPQAKSQPQEDPFQMQQQLLQMNREQHDQLQHQQQLLMQQQQHLLQQQQQNQMVALALQQRMVLAGSDGLAVPGLFGLPGEQLQYLDIGASGCAGSLQSPVNPGDMPRNEVNQLPTPSWPQAQTGNKRRGGRRGKGANCEVPDMSAAQDRGVVTSEAGPQDAGPQQFSPVQQQFSPVRSQPPAGMGVSSRPMGGMQGTMPSMPCLPGPCGAAAVASPLGPGAYQSAPNSPPKLPSSPSDSGPPGVCGKVNTPPKQATIPGPDSGPPGQKNFTDAPAYVTLMESDLKAATFLENELGPIGAPLRPIRSAAGRLDLMGGADSGDEQIMGADVQGPYGFSSSAGLVSFGPPEGRAGIGGAYGNIPQGLQPQMRSAAVRSSYFSSADAQGVAQARALTKDMSTTSGDRAASSGATSAGSSQVGMSSHNSNGAVDGTWEAQLFQHSGWNMDQREDFLQVKNTFLTFSPPQVKPIRSVRTAEGSLSALGSLLDDEP